MDLSKFESRIPSSNFMDQNSQYYHFWKWKIGIEKDGKAHILDNEHRANTCQKLLDILPGWQTWRGAKCHYRDVFPIALRNIASSYAKVRQYSLLDFNEIPEAPLKKIWHELGCVKEESGARRIKGDYCIISICKPLMFLWGQTLAFDSENRKNIRLVSIPRKARWEFSRWRNTMIGLQRQLLSKPEIVYFLTQKSIEVFNTNFLTPYGRCLDLYYLNTSHRKRHCSQ
ncbi:MAG: hypothetical protein HYX79_08920 [Chloroflexi bacterium]|nr:hypothetical protein [Chloroflexota bacterium]